MLKENKIGDWLLVFNEASCYAFIESLDKTSYYQCYDYVSKRTIEMSESYSKFISPNCVGECKCQKECSKTKCND